MYIRNDRLDYEQSNLLYQEDRSYAESLLIQPPQGSLPGDEDDDGYEDDEEDFDDELDDEPIQVDGSPEEYEDDSNEEDDDENEEEV